MLLYFQFKIKEVIYNQKKSSYIIHKKEKGKCNVVLYFPFFVFLSLLTVLHRGNS